MTKAQFQDLFTKAKRTHWQKITTERVIRLVDELRGKHGVSRKELWRTFSVVMVDMLKNNGAYEDDVLRFRRLLIDLGRTMDDSHHSAQPRNKDQNAAG